MAEKPITFLPFLVRDFFGLQNSATDPGHLEAAVDLHIVQDSGGEPVRKQLVFRGPGDVLGIHPRMIARLEPPDGTPDFEPNYFPFVEFADPDFLWRYSLEAGSAGERMHPWLSLLVLSKAEMDEMERDDHIEVISRLRDDRELLSVRGDLVPSLNQAWATAHVHLNEMPPGAEISEFVARNPASHCCRLLCCRHLLPETHYAAFLVPNYRIAVDAALGLGESTAGDTMAWDQPTRSDVLQLPIYHRWAFMTSEKGDFEELADKLAPTAVDPARVGTRAIDASRVKPPPMTTAAPFFFREGAVVPPGFTQSEPSNFTEALDRLESTLLETLSQDPPIGSQTDEDADPLLTLPVYGRYYPKTSAEPDTSSAWPPGSPWLSELNLEFRNRVAAGLGASAIHENQDEYLKQCWDQVGQIRKANDLRRLAKTALLLGEVMDRKHLQPLSNERFAQVTRPFHAHVTTSDRGEGQSFKQAFASSGLLRGVFSPTLKRLAHSRIGVHRTRPCAPWKKAATPPMARSATARAAISVTSLTQGLQLTLAQPDGPAPQLKTEVVPVTPIDLAKDFRPRFDLEASLRLKLSDRIRGGDGEGTEEFDPRMPAPEIETATYQPLAKMSIDYLMPGVEQFQNNGVSLMEENRCFIEAYMAGLNHEMMRELVWQRFPTDKRGTVFRFFWDPTTADNPAADIKEIPNWADPLGGNRDGDLGASLVLVLKGDLIRRYPNTIIYAVRLTQQEGGKWSYWSQVYPDEETQIDDNLIIDPVFRAQAGTDLLFAGFPFSLDDVQGPSKDGEYYFVLQENQDLPRFGLDVQSVRVRRPDLTAGAIIAAPPAAPLSSAPSVGGSGSRLGALLAAPELVAATGLTLSGPGGSSDSPQLPEGDLSWTDITESQMRSGYINLFDSIGGSSAEVAFRTYQKPIRVVIHASHLLAKDGAS